MENICRENPCGALGYRPRDAASSVLMEPRAARYARPALGIAGYSPVSHPLRRNRLQRTLCGAEVASNEARIGFLGLRAV